MRRETQVRIAHELLQQLEDGKNVDCGMQSLIETSSYVCPELADKEWKTFFREHPQLIGMSGDLPEPGSFFTIDDFGVPVLATRDKQGVFHAFLNACPHRGARVATEQRGKRSIFVCPFHSWSFSPHGELVVVPEMDHFGAIDKSCHGLIALPAVERNGMLWIHPQPDGQLDVEDLLGPLAEELASYGFDEMTYAAEKSIDMKLNWKLANDTFGETYHFPKLHKDTLGQLFYGNNLAYEEFGRHHRFVTARKCIDDFRDRPESEWNLIEGALVLYHLFPNIQLVPTDDRVTLIRIYPDPDNPGRSITRISIYFTQDMLAQLETVDVDEKVNADEAYNVEKQGDLLTPESILEIFSSTIENEDYVMGEQQQKTAESGLVEHSIFGRNEAPLHHFHNNYRDALGLPPLKRAEELVESDA